MKKGQKKRIWTPEQKSEIVHKHIDVHISLGTLAKEYKKYCLLVTSFKKLQRFLKKYGYWNII